MAYTVVDKGSKFFETKTYTGTGATNSVGGLSFKPDLVWIKQRSGVTWHNLYDINRGVTKALASNDTGAEDTRTTGLTSFNTDGFTLGTDNNANGSSNTYCSWNWLGANTTVSNTAGSISSTVSANTTSGFSIVSYTGNGSTSATVGHGLGVIPAMIIIKNRSTATQWFVKHKSLATDYNLQLNSTDAQLYLPSGTGSGGVGNLTSSSTFGFTSGTTSANNVNASGDSFIAYCFAEVKGYSKFGSYTGNGSADGTFVYTGMRPAFVMAKKTNATDSWSMWDNKRDIDNLVHHRVFANESSTESTTIADTTSQIDFYSNGFKWRGSSNDTNGSGDTYIYMCFSEFPFVTSKGIPTTAR